MTKIFFSIIVALSLYNDCLSQVKGANIKIENFQVGPNNYTFTCDINYISQMLNQNFDHFLVYYLKSNSSRILKIIKVNDNNLQQNAFLLKQQTQDIEIQLLPFKDFVRSGFTLYVILFEGNIYKLNESINIIQQEFRDNLESINSVLNIYSKLGHRPLTYAEVSR
jgi:hypothetical protein